VSGTSAVRTIRTPHRPSVIELVFLVVAAGVIAFGVRTGATAAFAASTVETTTTTTAAPATTTTTVAATTTSTAQKSTTTTKRPTTTTRPSKTTTTTAPATTTTKAPASTTSTAPAALVPGSTSTTVAKSTGSGGLSAETQLRLVVGGLIAVGGLVGFLTVLYWRRTKPPQITGALDALADLDSSALPGAVLAGTATGAPGGPSGVPAGGAGAPVGAAGAVAAGAVITGSGVRILGPVGEPKATTDAVPVVAPPVVEPTQVEPEPLTIVTLEDLRQRVAEAAASGPVPDATPVTPPDPAGDGYGDDHE